MVIKWLSKGEMSGSLSMYGMKGDQCRVRQHPRVLKVT